jgi:hypothetical protein
MYSKLLTLIHPFPTLPLRKGQGNCTVWERLLVSHEVLMEEKLLSTSPFLIAPAFKLRQFPPFVRGGLGWGA